MRRTISMVFIAGALWACDYYHYGDSLPPPTGPTGPSTIAGSQALASCGPQSNWYEVWVTRAATNDIKLIDGARFQLNPLGMGDTISLSGTGFVTPQLISFSKVDIVEGSKKAVVAMAGTAAANYADAGVIVIDTTDQTNRQIVGKFSTGRKTHHAIFSADEKMILAVNQNTEPNMPGSISFLDATNGALMKRLDLGGPASTIELSPDGTKAYVSDNAVDGTSSSKVIVVDVATMAIDDPPYMMSGSSAGLRINSDGKALYVINAMGSIQKIDLALPDRSSAVYAFADGLSTPSGLVMTSNYLVASAGSHVLVYTVDGKQAKDIPITAAGGETKLGWMALSLDCRRGFVLELTDSKIWQIDTKDTLTTNGQIDLTAGTAQPGIIGVGVRRFRNPDM